MEQPVSLSNTFDKKTNESYTIGGKYKGNMDDRTTLLDIATQCNLSKSTVSRVLNGNAGNFRISPATVEKVLRTAKKLNYRPNRLARAITNRRTHLIGLSFPKYAADDIVKERELAHNHRIMGIIFSAITQHPLFKNYDLVFHSRCELSETPLTEDDMKQDLLDGIIYSTPSAKHLEFLKMVNENIPLVLLGDMQELHNSVICVDINNRKMAKKATEHLLSIGRKNILLLVPEADLSAYCIQDRIDGYHDALQAAGLKANPDLIHILRSDEKSVSGFILSSSTLDQVDAILCLTDYIAMFCMDPLQERGLRIPEDIALMGFDGIDLFSKKARGLSTVKTPFHAMAHSATEHLLAVLENKTPYKPGFYEVPTELLIRESTQS